jgi:PRD1 phage membrane DNA delivery
MNDIMKDITAVLMAVIGVAILAVIVSQRNNTVGVLNAASGGFGSILGVAMGGAGGASSLNIGG